MHAWRSVLTSRWILSSHGNRWRASYLFNQGGTAGPFANDWETRSFSSWNISPQFSYRASHPQRLQRRRVSSTRPRSRPGVGDGTAFLDKNHRATQDEPKPGADHRKIGKNIFFGHELTRGSPLFLPDGTHVLLKLQEFLRAQYAAFGIQEVVTPMIYKKSLWEWSGHWEHYRKDMFEVVGRGASGETEGKEKFEDEIFGLKPMNCPGHCLMYREHSIVSSQLPIRYAEFSPLHRNEISGALTGLTRLRCFRQDDGHIFCREDQVGLEIAQTLQLVDRVYKAFGLGPYSLVLSTRPPDKYIGSINAWNRAEAQLTEALDTSGIAWTQNPGDGAFYGPKIDIILRDRNGKEHQTATIQLDFQLPQRFELQYRDPSLRNPEDASDPGPIKQPVLIHRAVLGSLERFLALLMEHTEGDLPLWLRPRQVRICTVRTTPDVSDYAERVAAQIRGFEFAATGSTEGLVPLGTERIAVTIDHRAIQARAKVRSAWSEKCGIVVMVGDNDLATGTVQVNFKNLRNLDPIKRELQALEIEIPRDERNEIRWDRVKMTPPQLRTLVLHLTAKYI